MPVGALRARIRAQDHSIRRAVIDRQLERLGAYVRGEGADGSGWVGNDAVTCSSPIFIWTAICRCVVFAGMKTSDTHLLVVALSASAVLGEFRVA